MTSGELDRALAERQVQIRPTNKRLVRCLLQHCRVPVAPGSGGVVWIRGQVRGTICPAHWKDVVLKVTQGAEVEDGEHHEQSLIHWKGIGT